MADLDELVGIAEAPEAEEAAPMDLAALMELYATMGRQALSEAEYQRLQAAQTQADFAPGAWFENLAEQVEETELARIAQEVWRWAQWDEESRKAWQDREKAGIRMLGITDSGEAEQVLEGLATVVHPGLAEAVVQFWARSITEIFPSEGPVKTRVLGDTDERGEQQAERVQAFMNYQYTRLMPGAYQEKRRLLMRLPVSGSVFSKVYFDPELETNLAVTVEPADMLVPYAANDLRTSPRLTHRMWLGGHLMQKRMQSGYYRNIPLTPATEANYPDTRREIEDTEGRTPVIFIEDRRHCVLECHCWLAVKGLDEAETLPWVVTLDRDSQKILALRRNWDEADPKRNRLDHFSHWQFLPGFGFYGLGLAHFMGGLSQTQTGMVRAILDNAAYENLQGGFMASDLRVQLDGPLKPGEFRKVEATMDELGKGLVMLPRHPTAPAMVQMLQYLDGWQQKFSSTVDAVVGDANNNGPVGTTLALIEQALKVPTAIHQGLHEAFAEELAILARLNSQTLPQVYPFKVVGGGKEVFAADFDDRVDIVPVSDPRLSTNAQKITQQQALLQLASQAPPGLYDLEAIHRRMLEALRIDDVDDVLPERKPPRIEPIEEGMAMLIGKPVQAYADQDHQAHNLLHDTWFHQLPPEFQQQLQAVYLAHKAEHLAWLWRMQMEQALGAPLPPATVMDKDEKNHEELPPEQQAMIEQAGMLAVQLMAQQEAAAMMAEQAAQQDQQRLQLQAKTAQQDSAFEREQSRLDHEAARKIERENAIAQAEQQRLADADAAERIRQQSKDYQ